jgi:PKD repeat protein
LIGVDFTLMPEPAGTLQPALFTGIVAGGSLPVTYTWDFGDGSAVQTGNSLEHTYTVSNTFPVMLRAVNSCPSVITMTRSVAVIDAPDINVTPSVLSAELRPDTLLTQTLSIENQGLVDLSWSWTEVPSVGWLNASSSGGTLLPSGSVSLEVNFDATGLTDVYSTTLEITSNDLDTPVLAIPVTLTIARDSNIYLPLVLRGF